ncbi:MAG: deoxyribodipyrimidine photo-lyase, partial [Candidatus Puniceispirillaceae bacterium]
MAQNLSIVWFKRDLRIHDHAPLAAACATGLPVLPLYVVEPDYWQQPFASRRHWHFVHGSLTELRDDCANLGQPLVVRTGSIINVFDSIAQDYVIEGVYAHEETSNLWGYQRDENVRSWCLSQGIGIHEFPTNGIVRRLPQRDDWARLRNQRMAAPLTPKPDALLPLAVPIGDIPAKHDALFGDDVPGLTQTGGRRAGVKTLHSFLTERGSAYLFRLSAPGLSEIHCSRLSTHLT